jgi:membrane protein DedA with SNARE-associated domain
VVEELADLKGILEVLHQFWTALQTGSGVPLGAWSYFLLGFLVLVEGPIATLLGAAASSTGLMNPFLVFASASIGNLTADTLWYYLGYAGRADWLVRHGRFIKLRQTHVERLVKDINLHARKILFFAKLTASFSVPALIAAGMARVPLRRWFGVLFGAEMLWTGTLVLIGYHFTLSISKMEAGLKAIAILAFALILFVVGRYGFRFLRKWGELVDEDDEQNGHKPSMASEHQ